MAELPAFLLAALALTGSPGPNTLSLAAVGAAFGRRGGVRYLLGLCFGMLLVIVITGSGVSVAVFALPGVALVISICAAAYFLWLAWRIASAPPLQGSALSRPAPRWYEGTALSLMNPKAYAAMAALFSGFTLISDAPAQDAIAKTAALMSTILFVNVMWLSIGAGLTGALRDPRLSRLINLGFAAALLLSVAAVTLL